MAVGCSGVRRFGEAPSQPAPAGRVARAVAGKRLTLLVVVSAVGVLAAISALHRSVTYLQHPNDPSFAKMVTAWSVLGLLCLLGVVLAILNAVRARRFDPNAGDPQARIAVGRSRAVTRAEFEEAQRPEGTA